MCGSIRRLPVRAASLVTAVTNLWCGRTKDLSAGCWISKKESDGGRPRPCKPDSVPPASRDCTVISLPAGPKPRQDPDPVARIGSATSTRRHRLAAAGQAARFPCSVLLRAGFAVPPGSPLGAVSFYLPVSPLPAGPWSCDRYRLAVCFLWHFPLPGTLSPRSPGLHRARCLVESGLSSRRQSCDHRRATVRGVAWAP